MLLLLLLLLLVVGCWLWLLLWLLLLFSQEENMLCFSACRPREDSDTGVLLFGHHMHRVCEISGSTLLTP